MAYTTSSVKTTVFGDMRVVTGKVANVTNTGDEFDTGLDYVYWADAVNEDAAVAKQLALNSNDGTVGTSNGEVYIKLASGTDDMRFFAFGK